MFNIQYTEGAEPIACLDNQFEAFKSFCRLPSFSVRIKRIKGSLPESASLIQRAGDYSYYIGYSGEYYISFRGSYLLLHSDLSQADLYLSDNVRNNGQYEASYLLMQAYMYRLVDTGSFMIHSAAVVFDNSGILFCGVSGAGKSTQANLWKEYLKARILNYDKPCIITDSDGIWVHGSPWSGKEEVYVNDSVHIKAIVFVQQSETNSILRLSPANAYLMIYMHNYLYPFSEIIEKKYSDAVSYAARNIPVYTLYCDISEEAVETLYNELFKNICYREKRKEINLKYRIKQDYIMRNIAGEDIVVARGPKALEFKGSFVFNDTGAFLWKYLNVQDCSIQQLAKSLSESFSIEYNAAEADVRDFIASLKENDLLDEV